MIRNVNGYIYSIEQKRNNITEVNVGGPCYRKFRIKNGRLQKKGRLWGWSHINKRDRNDHIYLHHLIFLDCISEPDFELQPLPQGEVLTEVKTDTFSGDADQEKVVGLDESDLDFLDGIDGQKMDDEFYEFPDAFSERDAGGRPNFGERDLPQSTSTSYRSSSSYDRSSGFSSGYDNGGSSSSSDSGGGGGD